jgi:hypothetical protein
MLALHETAAQAIHRQQTLSQDVRTLTNLFASPSAVDNPPVNTAIFRPRSSGHQLIPPKTQMPFVPTIQSTISRGDSPSIARSRRLQGGNRCVHNIPSSTSTSAEALPHHATLSERIGRRSARLGLSPEQEVACCQILQVGLTDSFG